MAGIDLEIARGEFFTLLGPSGSGKTTTLRMIAGFEEPDAGSVELAGRDVSRPAAVRPRGQHRVPGLRAVPAHDRGRERRVRDAGPQGAPARSAQAAPPRRWRWSGCSGYESRKPSELSGGQRQRVALARAIVNRPRVLLLDEPLGALDLKLREQMQVELKGIQGEVGITFIYVTHDQDEALDDERPDRGLQRGAGRAGGGARPRSTSGPATRFVTGFVGVSNVLERDGRRFTVRPEKIRLLEPDRGRRRAAHRARRDPRRRLRGDGDPVPGRAR